MSNNGRDLREPDQIMEKLKNLERVDSVHSGNNSEAKDKVSLSSMFNFEVKSGSGKAVKETPPERIRPEEKRTKMPEAASAPVNYFDMEQPASQPDWKPSEDKQADSSSAHVTSPMQADKLWNMNEKEIVAYLNSQLTKSKEQNQAEGQPPLENLWTESFVQPPQEETPVMPEYDAVQNSGFSTPKEEPAADSYFDFQMEEPDDFSASQKYSYGFPTDFESEKEPFSAYRHLYMPPSGKIKSLSEYYAEELGEDALDEQEDLEKEKELLEAIEAKQVSYLDTYFAERYPAGALKHTEETVKEETQEKNARPEEPEKKPTKRSKKAADRTTIQGLYRNDPYFGELIVNAGRLSFKDFISQTGNQKEGAKVVSGALYINTAASKKLLADADAECLTGNYEAARRLLEIIYICSIDITYIMTANKRLEKLEEENNEKGASRRVEILVKKIENLFNIMRSGICGS